MRLSGCALWRPIAVASLLSTAVACSAPQRRPTPPNPAPAKAIAPKAAEIPLPDQAPTLAVQPQSPWQRMRKRFALSNCDYSDAVLVEARRYTRNPQRFSETWRSAMPLMLLVLEQIESHDLPGEFALLPYVESHYQQLPAKGRGPAGMWQLTAATAVDRGLRISDGHDERLDPLAATDAVIGLIERYDREFADWRAANMAFNAGEFRFKRALAGRNASTMNAEEFARLKLSPTTHQHFARLLALACIIAEPQRFTVTLPEPEPAAALQEVVLPSAIDLRLAAALASLHLDELVRLNAAWSGQENPSGPASRLLLPRTNVDRFKSALAALPTTMLSHWTLQRLDASTTLDTLASSLDIPSSILAAANHLEPDARLLPGIRLLLPGREADSRANESAQTHTIKRGDTLSTIARRYGVRLEDLLRWNAITTKSILRPGSTLKLGAPSP